jgi:hypothetical protein
MNVKIKILLFFILFTNLSFSQKKQDVYFLLKKNSNKYLIAADFNKKIEHITLFKKKEYLLHKTKVKEAKKNGTYEYNHESGRDNLKIHVPKLKF